MWTRIHSHTHTMIKPLFKILDEISKIKFNFAVKWIRKMIWIGQNGSDSVRFVAHYILTSRDGMYHQFVQNGTRAKYTILTLYNLCMWVQSSAFLNRRVACENDGRCNGAKQFFHLCENGVCVLNIILLTRADTVHSFCSQRKASLIQFAQANELPRFSLFITNRTAINVPLITMNMAL